MIELANPEMLWLLAALPLWLVLRGRRGRAAAMRYSSVETARRTARVARSRFGWVWPFARVVAAGLLVIALARPQAARATQRVDAEGIDLMLAVDVSGSMEALDMQSNGAPASRIEVVKDVVARFVAARPDDRIGLVVFAGAPYLVSPLTLDHDWLLENLDRVTTGMVEDGTAIGSALATSVDRLRTEDAKSRVVVLLTDGMNNAGTIQPSMAAEAARALGVQVHTIGVGANGRAPMPVTTPDGRSHVVMTEVDVDEPTLRAIAETTGGAFFRATDTASLESVYARIDEMEKTERSIERFEHREERFAWFLVPGALLLALELLGSALFLRRVP